jgi:hypothetical protein
MPPHSDEQELLAVDQLFHPFHSKFGWSFTMKVVSLGNLDKFDIGRF